ncbi:MAG: hypothetical protein AAF441_11015 [Pseudomonadota bacterium]
MNNKIKNALMGGTILIASSIALTTLASAADGNARNNTGPGIQSVVPKAPVAKIRNRSKEARNRLRERKRIEFVRPKAPAASADRSRQIVVVPKEDERGLATETEGDKQLFSVRPKAPEANKPVKVVDARPDVEPEREANAPRKEFAEGAPQKEVVEPDQKIESKPAPDFQEKAEPEVKERVEQKAKPAPKKRKKVVRKRKIRIYGEVYTYNSRTGYYESEAHYYDDEGHYESTPSYNHGYHGGGSYDGGSSYDSYYHGSSYQGSSYGGSGYYSGAGYGRYNCK